MWRIGVTMTWLRVSSIPLQPLQRLILPLDHSNIIGMTSKRTNLVSLSYASVEAVSLGDMSYHA
jgi:hypothetical protein